MWEVMIQQEIEGLTKDFFPQLHANTFESLEWTIFFKKIKFSPLTPEKNSDFPRWEFKNRNKTKKLLRHACMPCLKEESTSPEGLTGKMLPDMWGTISLWMVLNVLKIYSTLCHKKIKLKLCINAVRLHHIAKLRKKDAEQCVHNTNFV